MIDDYFNHIMEYEDEDFIPNSKDYIFFFFEKFEMNVQGDLTM